MTDEQQVSSALTEILVPLKEDSCLQEGITNYWRLCEHDSLLCELIELHFEDSTKPSKKIGGDILLDVKREIVSPMAGTIVEGDGLEVNISEIDRRRYQMGSYDYALLRIKKVIKAKRERNYVE